MSLITPIGSLGTANEKSTASIQLDMAVSRTVAVDRLLVAYVAWDSVYSIFQDNMMEHAFQCRDTQDNVWCLIAVHTDRQDFFNTGAWTGIFVCQVINELTDTDTISVEADASFLGIHAAKCISVEEFDITGYKWAQAGGYGNVYVGLSIYYGLESPASQPAAIALDLGRGRPWLELHSLGTEAPDTDSFTWDSNWTEITGTGTTGGADDTNILLRGGYRIAAEQVTSVSVTNDTDSTRDNTQTLTAIGLIKITEFPNTPLIDDFNRADEYPMDGGLWITTHVFLESGEAYFGAFGQVIDNQMTGPGGSALSEAWGPCQEAYATVSQFDNTVLLHVCTIGNSVSGNMEGYATSWMPTGAFSNLGDAMYLGGSGSQGDTPRGFAYCWATGGVGYKYGLQLTKDSGMYCFRLWIDRGAGWVQVAAQFARDGSPGRFGRAALAGWGDTGRQDDFGGGTIECGGRVPQVMRYS